MNASIEVIARSSSPAHAYPHDLAGLVRKRWCEVHGVEEAEGAGTIGLEDALPDPDTLERLLSVCYQASLLHEEGRPVTFRLAVADPACFVADAGPPAGLHRVVFTTPRPFDPHELRRLAPAATFQRSLIGVRCEANELYVWGLVHSGPSWLQAVRGGRRIMQSVPRVLTVAVIGPGRVLVSMGTQTLAGLAGGTLASLATDVFAAPWLASFFRAPVPAQNPRDEPSPRPAALDPAFSRKLAEHVLRRVVATIRGARHGGTLILLPAAGAAALCNHGRYLTLKYAFSNEEPRRRIPTLMRLIVDELAARRCQFDAEHARPDWNEYETSTEPRLAALDEALFEVAHLVAMLANVDGAVVMTDAFELLGFGAEISSALAEVATVERSLDLEGTQRVSERTDRVGTRHRSSYRLCQHLRDALVIVVSQDGGVRFVRWQDGAVVYFDQIATGPWEV